MADLAFTQKEMAYVLRGTSQILVGEHDSHPAASELVINLPLQY